MNLNLKGKRILFIGPIFYDYHILIQKELEELGGKVYFFPERDYSLKFTVANNLFNKRVNKLQEKHYDKILKKTQEVVFDFLFVIRGYKMTKKFIDSFKEKNPTAQTIMYQWDSDKNNCFLHLSSSFDKVLSFDRQDSVKNDLIYLPLFYMKDIGAIRIKGNLENKYDILFFGYYIKERYDSMLNLIDFCNKNNIILKTFLYMPLSVYIKELLKGNKIDFRLINLKPLSRVQYIKLLASAKVVFDTSSVTQSGLSMRVIETIGAGKKLITSNRNIIFENFYNSKQIYLYEKEDQKQIVAFLKSDFFHVKTNLSLKNWIYKIFATDTMVL